MSRDDAATQTMIRTLESKTGKTLADWVSLARAAGLSKHGELRDCLKTTHDLTHGYANLVAHKALESDAASSDPDDLIAAQYAGAKSELKPLYDRLIAVVRGFGSDVEVAPKKGYVSLRRRKQFGLLQPSTATRLDVGLVLKGAAASARLEPAGSFNAMVTHRVRLSETTDIDPELIGWLKLAYDRG